MDKLSLLHKLLIFQSALMVVSAAPTPSETFSRRLVLSAPDNYIVHWNYNQSHIVFEVHVKTTTGFMGLGFSPNGGMPSSDIVIGGFTNGKPYIEDRYASAKSTPELDSQQDWSLISGSQSNGFSIFKFSRLLQTCDSWDRAITNDTTRLIWAYSSSATLTYHGTTNRGTKSLQLLEPEIGKGQSVPADASYIDFQMDNVIVPATDTNYHCRNFRVPANISTKHHIFRVDPLIESGNELMVHHILLQACHTSMNDSVHGYQYTCQEWEDHPVSSCVTLMAAWAIGGPIMWFPKDVGLPLGDGHITFMVMQMHYDNPSMQSGRTDSSGLRVWITPTLRTYDAGILEAGAIPSTSQIIPPGQNSFTTHGWCSHSCFTQIAATHPEGITIFATVLHTHLIGTAVRFRHFRNGFELPPIATDEAYDFDFQTFQLLQAPVKVLPTDDLLVECVYKSTDRTNVTVGGPATKNEMCLVFALYYPRMSFSLCLSTPTETTIKNSLINANANPSKSVTDLVTSMDWSSGNNVKYYQDNINKGQMLYWCQNSGGQGDMPTIVSAFSTPDSCSAASYLIPTTAFMTSLVYLVALELMK